MNDATVLYERLMRRVFVLFGARSHSVAYRGGSIHALDMPGRGGLPPVVLLHGFTASASSQYGAMTRRLMPRVSRLVLPDLPGHGLSSVPARIDADTMETGLCACLDALLRRPVVIFASSLSGGLAVRYAQRRPEMVAGLMLCSPSGAPLSDAEKAELVRMFRIDSHRHALAFVDRLFPGGNRLRQMYAWGVRQQFKRPHLVKLLDDAGDIEFLRPAELATLRMPVHLMWGDADRILPHSSFEYFRRHLPPGTSVETPAGFGHAPFLHRSEAVTASLLRFSERIAMRN